MRGDPKMKIYLFYINGIAGLEDWLDRELVFQVSKLFNDKDCLRLEVELEDINVLRKLQPGKCYGVQYDYSGGNKELKYYNVSAFEIETIHNSKSFGIVLYAKELVGVVASI